MSWQRSALIHVNIILAIYAGAGVSTSVRLFLDPSLYVVTRHAFPHVHATLAVVLPLVALAQLALFHFLFHAIERPRWLWFYAVGELLQLLLVSSTAAFVGPQLWTWPAALRQPALAALSLVPQLGSLYDYAVPPNVLNMMENFHIVAPYVKYLALAAGVALLVLLAAAGALAARLARGGTREKDHPLEEVIFSIDRQPMSPALSTKSLPH